MAPPAALRKRVQAAQLAAASAGGKPAALPRKRIGMRGFAAGAAATLAVLAMVWCGYPIQLPQEAQDPEVSRSLALADEAIRRNYNYTEAFVHASKAYSLAPGVFAVRSFYASVLLALGRVMEAGNHFHDLYRSGAAESRNPHFLQQYVLVLHRSGRVVELAQTWPQIQAAPGVKWTSYLQCPDLVDELLLEGATPFPDATGLRVAERLLQHRGTIQGEFRALQQRPDWQSDRFFRPNQDNDLVGGNEPNRWTEMLLFEKGQWEHRHCDLLPTACRIFRGLVEVEGILHNKRSGQVSLLKLEAGTQLVPHFGTVNWRYTAHLGLLVPDEVWMHVGNASRKFQQGELMVLDDSFLHSVEHNGTGPRVTLFVNFFHPKTKPVTYEEWLRHEGGT